MSASGNILLLSDNSGNDYVARIRAGAERAATSAGFSIVSVNIYGTELTVEDVLRDADCAAIVVTPPVSDDRHSLLAVEARKAPYVRIAPLLDPGRGNIVAMDEFEAASAITRLLTARGHRRIAIMRGPKIHLVSMRRYNGYANALGAKGLRVDPALVAQGDFTRQSGRDEAGRLFAAKPTAIFASNDEMAAGIADAAKAVGIAIPGDISLVGYDDNAVAATMRPALTTVRQPLEEMGEAAGRLAIECIRNPHKPNESVTVPFEIVERESVVDCSVGEGQG